MRAGASLPVTSDAGLSVPLKAVLLETSVRSTAPCPSCERQSGLSALVGGDCLSCSMRKAAALELGEALWSAATDNAGIGWRAVRPLPVS